ncbi:hypothetical protein [Spiroplasma endosymbiont of Nomada rufipes]|uniref:hypothetical protein n=1 Tax=Spiroplasma endosymbiont of Nomada rufipes TaxID=3077933 RepID=UPI00376F13AF
MPVMEKREKLNNKVKNNVTPIELIAAGVAAGSTIGVVTGAAKVVGIGVAAVNLVASTVANAATIVTGDDGGDVANIVTNVASITCAAGGVAILGTPTIIGLVAGGAAVGSISGAIDGGFEITQMLAKKDDEKQEEQKLDFEGSKKIINSNLENLYSSTSVYNSNTSTM